MLRVCRAIEYALRPSEIEIDSIEGKVHQALDRGRKAIDGRNRR
jgi:hypothetical protein